MRILFIKTYIARGFAAVGSLFFVYVIAQLHGVEGVGVYTLAQSMLLGVAILSRYGMNSAIMKYSGRSDDLDESMVLFKWATKLVFGISILFATILYELRWYVENNTGIVGVSNVLVGVAVASPAFTLSYLIGGLLKGVGKPVQAVMLENGVVLFFSAFVLIFFSNLTPIDGLSNIGWSLATGSWVIFVIGGLFVNSLMSHSKSKINQSSVPRHEFLRSSNSFFIISMADFAQNVVIVYVAAIMLSEFDLGLLKAAERGALLIAFVLVVINAVFPPKFARLYFESNVTSLKRVVKNSAIAGGVFAFPIFAVCVLFPSAVLSVFGKDFQLASDMLVLFSIAQFFNVVTGSVALLLNMTGNEALVRNVLISCNIVSLVGFYILTKYFGAIGGVFSMSIVLVCQNAILMHYVAKRLNIRVWGNESSVA
jgi:O-antigen/teichoic acid export membrane protein